MNMEGGQGGPMSSGSSLNKFEGSQGTAQEPEESGWTKYFEDFSSDTRKQSSYSNDSFGNNNHGSPSLVSDAASPTHVALEMPKFIKKETKGLNVKKQRTKKYACDDLEDTASSPVSSPKVSSLKQMDIMNHGRMDDDSIGKFLGKDTSGHDPLPQSANEKSSINFDGKSNNEHRDLKKRGLCLMPFSMLVNYLG